MIPSVHSGLLLSASVSSFRRARAPSPRAPNAKTVPPVERMVVTAPGGGPLKSVTVTAGNTTVAGTLDTDQRTWRSTADLAYGQTYTVTVAVADPSGATSQKTSTFTTLKPASTISMAFQANALTGLKSGGTYGIGQIPIVRFSRGVADKAAAEKAVVIETTPQ